MYNKLLYLLILPVLLCCTSDHRDEPAGNSKTAVTKKHTVAILPFSATDKNFIVQLQKAWQKKLLASFIIIDETALPVSAFYKPRQRYIADSLLAFLGRINNNRYEKIIGITTKDISTRKGDIENWGILGLGSCPGQACVISSFRAGKNKVAAKDFLRRMTTLGLHELGHTYGLEHWATADCLMKDAEGKMNLDDGDNYCDKCRKWLSGIGILQ
jgi:archaemetzincin